MIRLTCTECKQSLKVPEAALGKKIQCPACGARFIGRLDPSPPAEAAFAPLPNLELDEPPRQPASAAQEPEEPVVLDEVEVVEDADEPVRTPAPVRQARQRPRWNADEPEVVEEAKRARGGRARPRKKPSRTGLLLGLLTGGLLLLLAVCGGGGFAIYRLVSGGYADSDWKDFSPPGSRCHVLMPGTPVETTSMRAGMQLHKYLVTGKWRSPEFALLYFDLPPHVFGMTFLDTYSNAESTVLVNAVPGSRVILRRPIAIGNIPGREFHIEAPNKEIAITRIYLVKLGTGPERIYGLLAGGPKIEPDTGYAAKFFDSFALDGPAPAPTINPPPKNPPPAPNPKTVMAPPSDQRPDWMKRDPVDPKTIPGLLGYWAFDEAAGQRVADGSGNGSDGTAHGGKRVKGIKGQALCLDGKSDYFDFGQSPRFNFPVGGAFTFAGWFQTRGLEGRILSMRNSRDGSPVIDVWLAGQLHALVRQDGDEFGQPARVDSASRSSDGQWHHFALTRNGQSTIELFLDGRSIGKNKATHAGGAITTDLRIVGEERYHLLKKQGASCLNGCIDEFCVYNRALTAADIAALAGK